jgi:hypothetical protein
VRDIAANEEAAGECSCLCSREESDVGETVELQSTAESSDEGNTDLHSAVMAACKTHEACSWFIYKDINGLMTPATNLNMPNKKGYTAIGIAAEYPNNEIF